jgi:hypothetical protein
MRLCLAVALLLPFGTAAWAQSQDNGGSAIYVPPAPPVVAAPVAPLAPVAPVPPAPPPGLVQTPLPQGLVQTPVPPGPVAPEQAPADNGVPDTAAPSPPAPAGNAPAGTVPGATAPGAAPSATAAAPPPPDAAPVIPNTWVPGTTATLGVLNKVDGGTSQVSIPVGGQSTIGDLQVSVQACDTRPPDQLPDTSIFLTVQGAPPQGEPASSGVPAAGTTLYRGWMVRSTPGATVVGDGSETFRVINCS